MSRATFFDLDCPTCGRPLQVRINLLGKPVKCRHCRAAFTASPSSITTFSSTVAPTTTTAGLGRATSVPADRSAIRASVISDFVSSTESAPISPDLELVEKLLQEAEQWLADGVTEDESRMEHPLDVG
jgi:hypothetical protein